MISKAEGKQKTIAGEVSLTGVGLHTGKNVPLTFKPADENTGMFFKRVDLEDSLEGGDIVISIDFQTNRSAPNIIRPAKKHR